MKEKYITKSIMIFANGPREGAMFSFEFLPTFSYIKFFSEHTISFSWLFWEIGISYEKNRINRYY